MSARRFVIEAVDTLFFRDGRPFNQDDEGMAEVRAVFPPAPSVAIGAVRASLARAQGWPGHGDWGSAGDVLGDGPENTGRLAFGPSVLLRRRAGAWERLYPVPLHLLGKKTPACWALTFVRPGERLVSDLGEASLPELARPLDGAAALAGWWVTPSGMQYLLEGLKPSSDDLVPDERLWRQEYRVGLQRGHASRAAVRGMLYVASHVRPGHDTALGLEVAGLPADWAPQRLLQLGGFQRLAAIEAGEWREAASRTPAPRPGAPDRYVVVLTSPLPLLRTDPQGRPVWRLDGWNRPGRGLAAALGLPGELVSACVERPAMIGGWDGRRLANSEAGFRGPLPMRPCLPAGSAFFFEADSGAFAAATLPLTLGDPTDAKLGHGRYLIGRWPEGGER